VKKHFFTGVVEFTIPGFCEKVDADTFGVKLAVIGAPLKTGVWNRFYHMTNQDVVFDRRKSATKVGGMKGE